MVSKIDSILYFNILLVNMYIRHICNCENGSVFSCSLITMHVFINPPEGDQESNTCCGDSSSTVNNVNLLMLLTPI